ncbi:AAA family ATPase [Paenibacillus hamazuiensis]|uniref:AAA family ATPase n=1 Tax=Paenibacillus hamazuiensis TaxID=2936508 RepID=UPI00200C72B5|nr:AAA family ATPase [Paenibacillus hamazuiensis]
MTEKSAGIILVTGIMASGKSTVAQLLAQRFAKSVHVRGDIFRKMIVNHRKEVEPTAGDEELEQLRLRYRLAAHCADAYFRAGFTVIVQDVVIGPMLGEFVSFVQSRPFRVVVLCPNTDAVTRREAGRSKKGYGAWTVEQLDNVLRSETPRVGVWLDSSEQTPDETVNDILKKWDEALLS